MVTWVFCVNLFSSVCFSKASGEKYRGQLQVPVVDIFISVCVYTYIRVCTCTHVHQALYQLFGSNSLCHYPLSSGTTNNFPHAYEHEIRTENTFTWTTSGFLHNINMIFIWKQYQYMYACNYESTFTCTHIVSLHMRQIVPYIYSCNSSTFTQRVYSHVRICIRRCTCCLDSGTRTTSLTKARRKPSSKTTSWHSVVQKWCLITV